MNVKEKKKKKKNEAEESDSDADSQVKHIDRMNEEIEDLFQQKKEY